MNTTHKKLQSAMEYLMTYGWAILIIAVVIGVLYALGIFNGSGFLGSFCTAQTEYFCANPILSTNSPTLNVTIGQDTRLEWPAWKIFAVRGTAFNASSPNITGSGAFYNGEKQIVTIPLNSILGNYIPIGTPFSGSLWAEYCNTPNCITPDHVSEIGIFSTKAAKLGYVTTSVSTTSLSTTSTTSTSTTSTSTTSTSTTSTATTAPTTTITPSGIIYSVPITLTNSQSSNTPSPFQQMVNITENTTIDNYLTYNGNFANFEYFTLSGNTVNVLPAWIESNNSGKLITWVKLPNGIPAKSNTIIYLGFASTTTNLLSSTGTTGIGEAPQLPCGSTPTSSCSTYAEYDDGASVFTNYWNFAGTTAPNGFTYLSGSGASYNNGVTLTATTNIYYSSATYNPSNYVLEGYVPTTPSASSGGLLYTTTTTSGGTYGLDTGYTAGESIVQQIYSANDGSEIYVNGASITYPAVYGIYWASTGTATEYTNYVNPLQASTTDAPTITNSYIGLYVWRINSITFNWLRIRAYPPNGVMPSVAFGAVQGSSPSVTVSPSSVSLLPGTSFTLTADVSNGTSPYTYQWYNDTTGTVPIAGKTSSTYTATSGRTAGTFEYYVKVTDAEPKTVQSLSSVVTVSSPPSGVTYYVPITLTNSQSVATSSPFQQMVNISENSFSSYLTYNGNFANFEYISPSGTVLPAWIESNNSGKLITWVKLPNGIPAKSNTIIYLGFASTSSNLLSSSGTTGIGEAPQLSSTYAEYDDGANVFNNYWNFAGTTVPSSMTSSGTVTINNGATVSFGGYLTTAVTFTYPLNIIADFGFDAPTANAGTAWYQFGYVSQSGGLSYEPSTAIAWHGNDAPPYFVSENGGNNEISSSFPPGTAPAGSFNVGTVYWGSNSADSGWINYANRITQITSIPTSALYLGINNNQADGTAPPVPILYWLRTRAYPPNGVMPIAAFGSVV